MGNLIAVCLINVFVIALVIRGYVIHDTVVMLMAILLQGVSVCIKPEGKHKDATDL